MNREIKFRAWYPYGDGGEMVEDVWIDLERGVVMSDNDDLCEREGHSGAELMQFTGLTDCNGVEIYEGDILKVGTRGKWEIGSAGFIADTYHLGQYIARGTEYEVIGNSWENPELLK